MTEITLYNTFKKVWGTIPTPSSLKDFYTEKRKFIQELSEKYGIDLIQVAGIFSALSPLKSVEQNQKLTENFLKGKFVGHFGKQKEKARRIKSSTDEKEIRTILRGDKTTNFFMNIYEPSNPNYVTIDRHLLKLMGNGKMINMTPRRYRIATLAIKKLAKEVNLLPCEVQSALWFKAKELYGNDI